MVIDHIAKPLMSLGPEAGQRGWAEDMTAAGQHANVHCKLSRMVTEVDPDNHQKEWGQTLSGLSGIICQASNIIYSL